MREVTHVWLWPSAKFNWFKNVVVVVGSFQQLYYCALWCFPVGLHFAVLLSWVWCGECVTDWLALENKSTEREIVAPRNTHMFVWRWLMWAFLEYFKLFGLNDANWNRNQEADFCTKVPPFIYSRFGTATYHAHRHIIARAKPRAHVRDVWIVYYTYTLTFVYVVISQSRYLGKTNALRCDSWVRNDDNKQSQMIRCVYLCDMCVCEYVWMYV